MALLHLVEVVMVEEGAVIVVPVVMKKKTLVTVRMAWLT